MGRAHSLPWHREKNHLWAALHVPAPGSTLLWRNRVSRLCKSTSHMLRGHPRRIVNLDTYMPTSVCASKGEGVRNRLVVTHRCGRASFDHRYSFLVKILVQWGLIQWHESVATKFFPNFLPLLRVTRELNEPVCHCLGVPLREGLFEVAEFGVLVFLPSRFGPSVSVASITRCALLSLYKILTSESPPTRISIQTEQSHARVSC